MSHLFLDIETYSAPNNPDSSINPYLSESKVIVISYSFYLGFKPPIKEEIKAPVFLKEWESNEKDILQQFYTFLREIQKSDPYVKITGFNILKFDLPYLFARMKHHGIASERDLYDILIRPFGVDIFQISPVISGNTMKHEQLWGINHKEASKFFNLQVKEGSGLDCSRYYDAKQYDIIMKYCTEELNFEQLLDAMYLHIRDTVVQQNQNITRQ
ncbi:hypothetical protein HY488_03310 [Candidatus Woesearchaeota archaeon]|nr:hypothetical protein [Candidatus Woesearchaeota archaeon]